MERNFSAMQYALANNITTKAFGRIYDSAMRTITPIKANAMDYIQKHACCWFTISGHYDSYISKSCVSVLENKYLSKKYGSTLIDVDPSFALCTASIERVKKKVNCFPELVNKTIAPGTYSLVMDKDGTRMIVIKEPIIGKDDRSENGILGNIVHYSTTMIFIGKNREKWFKRVRQEIDDLVSSISKTNQEGNTIRYNAMSAAGEDSKNLQVRPMSLLTFPQKESTLQILHDFKAKEKIYKEYAVPFRTGILLSGIPGTGKTAFAFSLAQYMEMDCVSVNLDVFDKQDGDNKFSMPNTIYVIDEIDSQLVNRSESSHEVVQSQLTTSRRLLQLLKAMDSMNNGSIVVATTNYPERLDPALRRSGRFDHWIEMDDLSYEYAVEMVKARNCDPDEVLKGMTFPMNPAYLEQVIIQHILETNKIGQKEVASYESLGLNEEELKLPESEINNDLPIDDGESEPDDGTYLLHGHRINKNTNSDDDEDDDE